MKQILKAGLVLTITAFLGVALNMGLGYIRSAWTNASMDAVRHNLGDQVAIRANMNLWMLAWWGLLIVGILVIVGIWYLAYKEQFKKIFLLALLIILPGILAACTTSNFVIVTPPNYAIVVNMSDTTDQATTGNTFDRGDLVNVTQIQVNMTRCAVNSNDSCPDKLVAEVEGKPETRIYSKDFNSGTSSSNQALCFEANGANGCLDFAVTAIINREDAKCYANKMGVSPVLEGDQKLPSRFHYMATPLADALDLRVVGIASSMFAEKVANISPLDLAIKKFAIFSDLKDAIIKEVYKQTCITIYPETMAVNNGIVWASAEIQNQINQSTVLANQLVLVKEQNELLAIQNQAFIDRTRQLEQQFGLPAAVELMKIQKWDGTSYIPFLAPSPANMTAPAVTPGATTAP